MLAVGGLEQEELAVDRIAQGEALFLGTAGDGVEEKLSENSSLQVLPPSVVL
jgi:hypothetical protein